MIILISGPSGVGKTTLRNLYTTHADDHLQKIITTTSRPPRPFEKNGEDYIFVTRQDFETKIANGQMIEYAEFAGNYYGSDYEQLHRILDEHKIPVFIVDHQGIKNFMRIFDEGKYEYKSILIAPPSKEDLIQRLQNRKTESDAIIQKRVNEGLQQLEEKEIYDYIVINDDLKKASNDFNATIEDILTNLIEK